MNPSITVLVPVYNQERFIKPCLDSLVNQTYDNFNVVVLNDGSTDKTGEILDTYRSDSRFTFLYKQNEKSISRARNYIIKHITGEYFIFVDSDDVVAPQFLEVLMEALLRDGADISCCRYSLLNHLTKKKKLKKYTLMNREQALRSMVLGNRGGYVLWNKLTKSSLAKDIVFADFSFGEDFCYIVDLMQNDVKVAFVNDVLYFYRYFVNRKKKDVMNEDKKKFLKKMIEMEQDEKYAKDKILLGSWVYLSSLYFKTLCKGEQKSYKPVIKEYMKTYKPSFKQSKVHLGRKLINIIFNI